MTPPITLGILAGSLAIGVIGYHTTEPQLGWLETGVWLRARLPELSCEGEGSYVRAPGQRFAHRFVTTNHLPFQDFLLNGAGIFDIAVDFTGQ